MYRDSEHVVAIRLSIRRFLDQHFSRQQARECDKDIRFPEDVFKKLCETGICGLTISEEYGGMGFDMVSAVAVIEELSKRGTFLSGPFIHVAFYGGMNIGENGSDDQKSELLPQIATGDLFFAYGLSEPDVGGDLASASTVARIEGDSLIINGTKRWCTGARRADYILTLARTGDAENRYRNLSLILVPSQSPGIQISDIEHTGFRYSATTDVIFEDVRVPMSAILGGAHALNQGWNQLAGAALDIERIETAAIAHGIAAAAVEDAWHYAQQRKQFGKAICAHQAVRHSLADVQTQLEASRLMLYHAAEAANLGEDLSTASSMVKLFVAETAMDIVLACQKIMGAYGYATDYDMERYVRDIQIIPIAGGSSNMQRNNIANRMGLPNR